MQLYDAAKQNTMLEEVDRQVLAQYPMAVQEAQANTPVLIDGAVRYMAKPHAYRLVSTKDGSPLTNKVKISRNAPCPCKSGKKFKNCHQKGL